MAKATAAAVEVDMVPPPRDRQAVAFGAEEMLVQHGITASSTSPRQFRVPLTPGLPDVAGSGPRLGWPGSSARASAAAPVFARERLTGAWMREIRNAEKEKGLRGTRVE